MFASTKGHNPDMYPAQNGIGAKPKAVFLILGALHLALLVAGVLYMTTDPDEGGLLVLINEIMGGRVPVIDINAHNQPLLYYLYGLWMEVFGFSIESGRALSAAAVFATGVLIAAWVRRFTEDYLPAAACYLLFIADITFFKANILVKPFALSNFLILASFCLLTVNYLKNGSIGPKTLLGSGVLLGVSMGVRLIFPLPVISVIWLIYVSLKERGGVKEAFKKSVFFSIGVLIPLVPSVYIYIKEPLRAYIIWGGAYMQVYLGKGNNPDFMSGVLEERVRTGLMLRGILDVIKVPDMALLFILSAPSILLVIFRAGRDRLRADVYIFAWAVLAAIVYVYSRMFLNYMGYINQLVIFLILTTAPLMGFIFKRKIGGRIIYYALIPPALLAVVFFTHFHKKFERLRERLSYTGSVLTPGLVREISGVVAGLADEDGIVFDDTGLYVFTSARRPVKGFEYPTDAALYWNFMPEKDKAKDYLYIPEPELFRMFDRKEIRVAVLTEDADLADIPDEELKRSHISRDLKRKIEEHYDIAGEFFTDAAYTRRKNLKVTIYKPNGARENQR